MYCSVLLSSLTGVSKTHKKRKITTPELKKKKKKIITKNNKNRYQSSVIKNVPIDVRQSLILLQHSKSFSLTYTYKYQGTIL